MAYYPVDRPADMAVHGLQNARPGLHAVGEYQVAGRPFLKTVLPASFTANGRIMENSNAILADAGDECKVAFPAVTSRLIITNNTNQPIAVYFCSLTVTVKDSDPATSGVKVNSNFYVLPKKAADAPLPTLDIKVKCRYVYVAGYNTTAPGTGNVSIAAELTGICEAYDTDTDNIEGISG